MSESLDRILQEHFRGVSDYELMHRIERAADFGADDEEYELSRRLAHVGMKWMYVYENGAERVQVYKPEDLKGGK